MADDVKTPAWVGITYLLYMAVNTIVVIGGCGYAVFVLGYSGWWWILAVAIMASSYSPWRWHCIFTGKEVPYQMKFMDRT